MAFYLLSNGKKQVCSGIGSSFFIVFLFISTFACASTTRIAQVVNTEEINQPADTAPFTEPETGQPGRQIADNMQQVYRNYLLSSFNVLQGNYKDAVDSLKKVLEIDPESGFLNKKMAILMHQTKNTKEALRYAKKSISLAPEDTGTKLLLADLYAITGDMDLAIQQYEEILSTEPENQRIRMIYATVLAREGLLDEAILHLDKLIEQNPGLIFAHYYKGRIYQEMKQFKMAENEYLLALAINSSMEPALFDLAGLYHLQGDLDRAIDTYKRLLTLYPMNDAARERLLGIYEYLGRKEDIAVIMEEIRLNSDPGDQSRQAVGIYYLQNGMISESINELEMIVSAWPDDYRSRYYLAMAYERDGQPEKALEHFGKIGMGNELYLNARIHSAYILNEKGDTDRAIEIINKSLEINREEADLYIILASFYETKNDFQKAREILSRGLEYSGDNIELYFRLGIIFEKMGDKDASIGQMRKVLELDPNHADSLNFIGYTYAEKGINLDEALELIQKALTIQPESGYIIDSLGWVYYQKGQYEKALDTLKKAFSLVSEDPTIAEHLGDVYFKVNNYEKSIEMYEKALSLNHQSSEIILKKIEDLKKLIE